MARPLAHRTFCQNPPLPDKNELSGAAPGPAPTKGSNISTPTPAVSRVSTLASPVTLIVASNPAPALAVIAPSLDNKFFKQFMKAYLEA